MSVLAILAGAVVIIVLIVYLSSREKPEEILIRRCFGEKINHDFNHVPLIHELGMQSTHMLLDWLKEQKITPSSLEVSVSKAAIKHLRKHMKNHSSHPQTLEEYLTKK